MALGRRFRALFRVVGLLALFIVQLVNSLQLRAHPHHAGPIAVQAVLIIAGFVFAVERAWELVGVGGSGIFSTFAGLLGEHRVSTGQSAPPSPASYPDETLEVAFLEDNVTDRRRGRQDFPWSVDGPHLLSAAT